MRMSGVIVTLVVCMMLPGCSKGAGAGSQPAAPASNQSASTKGQIQFHPPSGWVSEQPSSSMRVAQYVLPKTEGDAEDATAVVYYFGEGQGGGVQENIDRWIAQVQRPDGSSSKDNAKTESMTVNGLKVTTLDVSGAYNAGAMAGGGANPYSSQGLSRMLAAVIETPKGAYFLKLVGPVKTVDQWSRSFLDFVKSVEFN